MFRLSFIPSALRIPRVDRLTRTASDRSSPPFSTPFVRTKRANQKRFFVGLPILFCSGLCSFSLLLPGKVSFVSSPKKKREMFLRLFFPRAKSAGPIYSVCARVFPLTPFPSLSPPFPCPSLPFSACPRFACYTRTRRFLFIAFFYFD